MNIRMIVLLSAVVMISSLTTMSARAFGDESYDRQHGQAEKGFDDLEDEFAEPAPAKPAPPQIIIKEKIIIREKLVPVPVPAPSQAPAAVEQQAIPKPSTRGRRVISNGYRFELQSCSLSNRNIECDITVRTPDDDRILGLYSRYNRNLRTSAFDNLGNQYYPSSTSLGNKQNGSYVEGRLIQGITTKIKIFFENVSSKTVSISLLELSAYDSDRKRFKIQFRDIVFES